MPADDGEPGLGKDSMHSSERCFQKSRGWWHCEDGVALHERWGSTGLDGGKNQNSDSNRSRSLQVCNGDRISVERVGETGRAA